MTIAITIWGHRVSPLFDTAAQLRIEPEDGTGEKQLVAVDHFTLKEKCRVLKHHRVGLVICGAISRGYQNRLLGMGIRLIPWICGDVDAVTTAYREGRLFSARFFMPGRRNMGLEACLPTPLPHRHYGDRKADSCQN
ncbi:MAG: hypothetical protein PVH30_09950 [Desulfobacterales bacterium]|jgi:hypothetical protein